MNTKTEILEILGDYVDTPVDEIDTSLGFKFSAGLDSFALLSFIGAVEDHFGIAIPNDHLSEMKKLDDIITFVDRQCPQQVRA